MNSSNLRASFESLTRPVATSTVNLFFNLMCGERHYETLPDSIDLSTSGGENLRIAAWGLRSGGDCRGTLVFLPGIGNHSAKPWFRERLLPVCSEFNLAFVGMDLRHHGKSGDAPPTFGAMEALDLAAVIRHAEDKGFPGPFIVYGISYGGMVAQRAAMDNEKITGVICENPPAWPWDAIAISVHPVARILEGKGPIFDAIRQNALAVGHLINAAYGRDVLSEGDIRRFPASPTHHPLFLYGVGDLEHHNPAHIRQAWEHIYPEENTQFNTGPKESPHRSKWFLTFPGVRHCEIPENPESKEKWWAEVHAFIEQVLERKGRSQ